MIKIYNMDVLQALKQMPDESVDMQITSPPYWGLRDYGKGVEVVWDESKSTKRYKSCVHVWEEHTQAAKGGYSEDSIVGSNAEIENKRYPIKSNFCSKCGAWKGQLGLEPDFNLFIKHLCDVFDEVKRVLKKEGTCFVNLGDTYYTKSGSGFLNNNISSNEKVIATGINVANEIRGRGLLPSKCLTCVPERFILEMISRGWILRNKIIWHKPNYMPTSVKDRFANSWEYLFMFSKSKKYYFDLDAVREPHQTQENRPMGIVRERTMKYKSKRNLNPEAFNSPRARTERETFNPDEQFYNPKGKNPDDVISTSHFLNQEYIDSTSLKGQAHANKFAIKKAQNRAMGIKETDLYNPLGKNPSDFWDITTRGYPEAHFAVFPEALVERPIKTTPKWICNKCGKAREKKEKTISPADTGTRNVGGRTDGYTTKLKGKWWADKEFLGWTKCSCNKGFHPSVILDIFAGSGTTLKVARRLHRDSIGIEIKKEYCELIKRRLFGRNQTLFPKEFKLIKSDG